MSPIEVTRQPIAGFDALGTAWRGLEQAVQASFFQSWTWVGCLASERYTDPLLLRAERDGQLVGLALFNRRRGHLHLAESGDPDLDRPFTEHNGPLAADADVAAALLRAAWSLGGMRGLVLGGVPPALVAAAGCVPVRLLCRPAPRLDLVAARQAGGDPLAGLSANARQQIRRSDRFYAGEGGLSALAADTPARLAAWFEALSTLHAATWRRRGVAGAFSTDFLRRFHLALMRDALARGELDLLRVSGPAGVVGVLYNLRYRGVVYAYQSGLADPAGSAHAKPGLTCHALAIARAAARGDLAYDFLAGDQRYKRSFADGERMLAWAELARPYSARALLARLRGLARRGDHAHRATC